MEKNISSGPEKNDNPSSLNQSLYARSTGSVASVLQVSKKWLAEWPSWICWTCIEVIKPLCEKEVHFSLQFFLKELKNW